MLTPIISRVPSIPASTRRFALSVKITTVSARCAQQLMKRFSRAGMVASILSGPSMAISSAPYNASIGAPARSANELRLPPLTTPAGRCGCPYMLT